VAVIETSGALPFGLGFIWLGYTLWTGADVSDNEQIPDYSLKRVSLINIVGGRERNRGCHHSRRRFVHKRVRPRGAGPRLGCRPALGARQELLAGSTHF
jgi:hypothetical protein